MVGRYSMHTNEDAHWQTGAKSTFIFNNSYSNLEIVEQAKSNMRSKGITPPDRLTVDSKIHRFGKDKSC